MMHLVLNLSADQSSLLFTAIFLLLICTTLKLSFCLLQIVSAVTELLIAQFMWLDFDNASKPIYLYINSSGTQVSAGTCCFLILNGCQHMNQFS